MGENSSKEELQENVEVNSNFVVKNKYLRPDTELKVQDGIIVLILSFVFGIFVTLVIEEPGIMLQKTYLPQISKWRKSSLEAKSTELRK
ncbi:unnamed protein product [Diabrotica balteata]|uniref:Uncharacterized protein n=1 Tax=Diabrotica balteata TaxID=107213 RepID=A0A9N9XD65_DIABA|nr:unnamed protein product [Diabrotica balteata]